jgi:hypothetical protein
VYSDVYPITLLVGAGYLTAKVFRDTALVSSHLLDLISVVF